MPSHSRQLLFIAALFALTSSLHQALASESPVATPTIIESSPLIPKVGHQGISLGARIEAVERTADGKMVKIEISLPKIVQQESAHSQLEEVIVYGTREKEDQTPLTQKQQFKVVNNLDEGRSGIVIFLDKQQDFVLHLNYTEPKADIEPDVYNR
jgi:hypothetical protein